MDSQTSLTGLARQIPAHVDAVLATAVSDGVLRDEQAVELRRRLAEPAPAAPLRPAGRPSGRLAELAGYAGGALVLGAAGLFLGTAWGGLGDGTRAAVLLGTAVALLAAGAVLALVSGQPVGSLRTDTGSPRRRLVSTLWALGALAVAGGVAVLADTDQPLEAAVAGLVVAAIGYLLVSGAPGHVAAAVAVAVATTATLDRVDASATSTAYALAYVGLAVLWTLLTATRVLRERDLGFALAAAAALGGAQLPVLAGGTEDLGYALTALVASAGYAGYVAVRSWPVLAAAVVATTLVVPEALHDWTDGSVPVAGALFVAGLTLLAASAAGFRLHRVPR